MLSSKQRVMCALNHEQADRIPLDIGGTSTTAIHALFEQKLKKEYNLEDHGTQIRSREQQGTVPEKSVMDFLGVDTCLLHLNERHPWIDNGDGTFKNMWGIDLKSSANDYYYDMVTHPLEDAEEVEDIEKYEFPEANEHMIEGLVQRADENSDKFCVLEGFRESCFGMPSWLRRSDNFYMDLLSEPEMAEALIDKLCNGFMRWLDFIMPKIGDKVDIVKFNDDLGTQRTTLISPDVYRKIIKPYQKKLFMHVKDKYHKPILFHCCGAIEELISDFIDIGVDALNPVQISADNMDPKLLKAKYGKNMCFWGGGLDTQTTLNSGDIPRIRREVKSNMTDFRKDGGFVFTPVHNIQPTVDLESFMAMLETYRENAEY